MLFRISDNKFLEKYKTIQTQIEDLKNIDLDALPVYKNENMVLKFILNFGITNSVLNLPENDIECESFTVISIDSLLVYNEKYYIQVFLDSCAYKIENKQMTDYLDENRFEDQIL